MNLQLWILNASWLGFIQYTTNMRSYDLSASDTKLIPRHRSVYIQITAGVGGFINTGLANGA